MRFELFVQIIDTTITSNAKYRYRSVIFALILLLLALIKIIAIILNRTALSFKCETLYHKV